MNKKIEYTLFKKDEAAYDHIYTILKETDADFIPKLSERYKLEAIAEKYITMSHCFIATIDGEPAGLFSFYPNPQPKNSYASLLSVRKKFRGMGIGKNLEMKSIEFCKVINSCGFETHMRKNNSKLFHSRLKMGYEIMKEYQSTHGNITMVDMYLKF